MIIESVFYFAKYIKFEYYGEIIIMDKKKKLDFTCKYCGKKYNLDELKTEGYTTETKAGLVVECANPKCEMQQLIDN